MQEQETRNQRKDNKNEEEKKSRNPIIAGILVLIIIIILLFLRSCGTGGSDTQLDSPIGNFQVSDEQYTDDDVKEEEKPTVTFDGYGTYTVTADKPNVELKNPEVNFVDMVFTLTDKETGEIIVRTDKVAAGNFVYVNVMDFYKEQGVYDVLINISAYDSETGTQLNGLSHEMELTVKT